MENPCYNPIAYLDHFCGGCQFTDICDNSLKMIGGKPPEKKKRGKKSVEVGIQEPVVETVVEPIVAPIVEKLVKKMKIKKVEKVMDLDI